jgi:O-antigen/teichoic acid export membrane protein
MAINTSDVALNAPIKRVALSSMSAFALIIAGAGLTCCSQLVIARIVGAETYGIYAYVLAWTVVLANFCTLGFDVALLRFMPVYQTEGAWALLRGVIQYAERRSMSLAAAVILVGSLVVLVHASSAEVRNTFLVGFALVPISTWLAIRCSIVRAFGGVVLAVAPDRVVREGVLLGLVVLASAMFDRQRVDAPIVMTAMLAGSVVGLAVATLAVHNARPRILNTITAAYAAPTWRRAALPLVVLGATELLMNRTGVLLLGWMGNTRDAGIYSLAFNIAFVVALPRTAINTLFAPTISGLFARKEEVTLQALIAKAASWTLAGAALLALILAIIAEPLLTWFGHGFADGATAMRILLLGQVIAAAAGSQLHVMTMTGHERSAAALLVASAAANAIASVVLINSFGLTGAAIAATVAIVGWNLAMAYFLWRRLHLLPGVIALFVAPLVANKRETQPAE